MKRLGDSLAVELPALDRATLVRIQVPQPYLVMAGGQSFNNQAYFYLDEGPYSAIASLSPFGSFSTSVGSERMAKVVWSCSVFDPRAVRKL